VCTQIRWDRQCDSNTVECSTDGATTLNVHYMYYVTISLPHVGKTKTKKKEKNIFWSAAGCGCLAEAAEGLRFGCDRYDSFAQRTAA